MNYQEAVKEVSKPKNAKENFIVINLSYDFSLVLPHKDGLAFLAALANAEQMDDTYSSNKHILPLERSKLTITQMSYQNYERSKIAALLGISLSSLEIEEERSANPPTENP